MLDPIEDDEAPIGMLCFANCACGSTLALCYEDTSEHVAFNRALADAARSMGRAHVDVGLDIVQQVNRWAREAPTPSTATAPSTTSSSSVPSQAPAADPLVLEFGAALLQTLETGQISIPPAPTAALKVRSLVASDDVNIRAVADALAIDPGLATGVLRVANSAHFNRGSEVSSLVQAVTRLGFKEVAQLSLTLGVGRAFTGGGPLAQHRAHLWRKSLMTAILAKSLARARRLESEDCFVGGLFSSLGAVVGLLSLEQVLKTRTDLPAQQWGWWLRLVDLFAADLGREAAARWQLPSVIASVAAHPHLQSGVRPAQHAELVAMIAVTRNVAERVLERPRIERADLEDIAGLTADERAQLVNAIPLLAQAVAAFDAGLPRLTAPPTSSSGAPPEPVPPPATPLMAATVVPDAVRCDVVGLVSEALVLQSPQAFPVTTLVAIELELEPRLRLWGVVTHAWSSPTGQCTRLAPFAVDDAAWNRWRLLVTEHAAARTQATLRQMEVAKRPR